MQTPQLIIILVISALIQFTAAGYAFSLMRMTSKKYLWLFTSAGLFLMGLRRLLPLVFYIYTSLPQEIIGLCISVFMLTGIIGIKHAFVDTIESKKEVQDLLDEKLLLLKEVHHRIKNNMYTLYYLLGLHASKLPKDHPALSELNDTQSRVESMMVLYDRLFRSSDFRNVYLKDYVMILADNVSKIFSKNYNIEIRINIPEIIINSKTMFPLAIIINEMLTNSFKYAFNDKGCGTIDIIASSSNNTVTLTVKDNGIGIHEVNEGFGLMLIKELTRQLSGKFSVINENGWKNVLEFSL